MKKVTLVVALAALCGLAANTFADVQNIRLSGDIRLRGYYLNAVGDDGAGTPSKADTAFVSQRTRVCVEADLEDHVLVVVTMKAEGLWGNPTTVSTSGSAAGRSWAVGIPEAYVQLNEVFYTPATLKLGRQSLNYGHGMIISSADQEYSFDAARLVLDYYPLTIDLVVGQLATGQIAPFQNHVPAQGASDLLFLNARYEMTDSILKDIEVYLGWVSQNNANALGNGPTGAPIAFGGNSPFIFGLRTDLTPTENFKVYGEVAYEVGSGSGSGIVGGLHSLLANVGASYTCKKNAWAPSINASYTYASGGGTAGRSTFLPWFDYAAGSNGYLFAPALSNIHIFNLGGSIKPSANTSVALQGYYYLKSDKNAFAGSNSNEDFGGYMPTTLSGANKELGWEFDAIVGYDYSKDVRAQFVYALFLPDNAFNNVGAAAAGHELRGELNVKF